MAEVFNSKHTSAEIEDILDSAGLVSTAEDETYSVKIVDSAGTLLLGIKLTGELDVPIGITDDAYNLIKATAEKLGRIIPAMQDWVNNNFTNAETIKQLIDSDSDSNYVMKFVDASGNVLQAFKPNGETYIPNGMSDDTYNLLLSLCKVVLGIIPSIQEYANRTFESSAVRKALIDSDTDAEYSMKMVDAEGNLLQGFKVSGESVTPRGITDDTYTILTSLCRTVKGLANVVKELKESVDKLS